MLNQVVLVGRLTADPEVIKEHEGHKKSVLNIAVPRSFKNAKGEYDIDFIRCVLWDNIAESTAEYCHKSDIIGIKGRIQVLNIDDDGTKKLCTEVVAEKVTFLSSNNKT